MTKRAQRQALLAAIARREWLLQMLALGATGCRRADDRAYARGNTLIAGVDGYSDERPLTPDEYAEFLVYLPLVKINDQGDRQPCLATDWKHSADYLEWTYRLRPGVRWHDGRPVTVDDVKFTIDLHGRPDSPVYGLGTECTMHDASTFTVRGVGWTRAEGADSYMSIVPKHLLKDLDYQKWYEWDFWLRPIGNGPYRYLRYQPGTMVKAREFEAGVCPGYIVGGGPGLLQSFFGEQSPSGYRNPQLTRLLEVLETTADPEAVDQAYREMSDLLRRDQPVAFLFRPAGLNVVHKRVKGLSTPWRADPIRSGFTDDLWLDDRDAPK